MESDYSIRHYFKFIFSLRPIIIIGAFYLMNIFQNNRRSEINGMSFLCFTQD